MTKQRQAHLDITDQTAFPWVSYFAGFPHGRVLLAAGVQKVTVVWRGKPLHRTAFYIEMADSRVYLHSPMSMEVFEERGVEYIAWDA